MKMINVYSLGELKDAFPDAYETVIDRMQREADDQVFDFEEVEMWDSVRAVVEAAGVRLNFRGSVENFGAGHLRGVRAMAWLENNLFAPLRIPWEPMSKSKQRQKFARYGGGYRPGLIQPCPFTGMCYDDMAMDVLRREVKGGECLHQAFYSMVQEVENWKEAAVSYRRSEAYLLEEAEVREYLFTEDGKQV